MAAEPGGRREPSSASLSRWPARLAEQVEALLVCPECHRRLGVSGVQLACPGCAFEGSIRDDVIVLGKATASSYFDDKFLVMRDGHLEQGGDWEFAYSQQVAFLESCLEPGSMLLDVGCGPSISYRKPAGSFLVGVEHSYPSIRCNRGVDLRVCGSAVALPLESGVMDVVICFYSLHHMVGASLRKTRAILERVLAELGRVLKPGGRLVVFEMRPWWAFRIAQERLWDAARSILGSRLDMYMWPQGDLEPPGGRIPGSRFEVRLFPASAWKLLASLFALPWLKVPRMLYPLSPVAYVWNKP